MSEYWKHQELDGNGLQTINQQYSKLRKEVHIAYALCALFPIGAHQFYLKNSSRGLIFIGLSLATLTALIWSPTIASILFFIEIILLAIDAISIDRKVVTFNKHLKMALSLQINMAPPENFKGRYQNAIIDTPIDNYMDVKNREVTAFETKKNPNPSKNKQRVYSFSEQEKLLREMSKKRKS